MPEPGTAKARAPCVCGGTSCPFTSTTIDVLCKCEFKCVHTMPCHGPVHILSPPMLHKQHHATFHNLCNAAYPELGQERSQNRQLVTSTRKQSCGIVSWPTCIHASTTHTPDDDRLQSMASVLPLPVYHTNTSIAHFGMLHSSHGCPPALQGEQGILLSWE